MRYKFRNRRALKHAADSISATEAAKNFGRLVDRVREKGTTSVVERHATRDRRRFPKIPGLDVDYWERRARWISQPISAPRAAARCR
jgi:hypothetical protein